MFSHHFVLQVWCMLSGANISFYMQNDSPASDISSSDPSNRSICPWIATLKPMAPIYNWLFCGICRVHICPIIPKPYRHPKLSKGLLPPQTLPSFHKSKRKTLVMEIFGKKFYEILINAFNFQWFSMYKQTFCSFGAHGARASISSISSGLLRGCRVLLDAPRDM